MLFLRYLWPLPVTIAGLVLALASRLTGGSLRVQEGIIVAVAVSPQYFCIRRGFIEVEPQ